MRTKDKHKKLGSVQNMCECKCGHDCKKEFVTGVRVYNAYPDIPLPDYGTSGAACIDLRIAEDVHLEPGQQKTVGTGLFVEIPKNLSLQIYSRSGMCHKYGLIVNNAPAIIDEDYRGEVRLILFNSGSHPIDMHRMDRVAQAELVPVHRIDWIPVESKTDLDPTTRGEKGFGDGSEHKG